MLAGSHSQLKRLKLLEACSLTTRRRIRRVVSGSTTVPKDACGFAWCLVTCTAVLLCAAVSLSHSFSLYLPLFAFALLKRHARQPD